MIGDSRKSKGANIQPNISSALGAGYGITRASVDQLCELCSVFLAYIVHLSVICAASVLYF